MKNKHVDVVDPEKVSNSVQIPDHKRRIPWIQQFCILFMRCLLIPLRAWKGLLVHLAQAMLMGILVGNFIFEKKK